MLADNEVILTRDWLLKLRDERGADYLRKDILPALKRLVLAHAAYHGWFYPGDKNISLVDDVGGLQHRTAVTDRNIQASRTGSAALKHRFRSFWHAGANGGPVGEFNDNAQLDKVLAYRIGLGPSKDYTYTLESGKQVTGPECFDISLSMVRRGYVMRRSAVSFFAPSLMVDIVRALPINQKELSVWDPSGGFGGRMLGLFAACPTAKYWANEPAAMTFQDLQSLADELVQLDPRFQPSVVNCGSETTNVPQHGTVDLVFTSPPYFDLEKYFDEPGQCWRDFPDEDGWERGYVLPTLQNAWNCLKADGLLVLNIDHRRTAAFIRSARAIGFDRVPELDLSLRLKADHIRLKNGGEAKDEPILVWRKSAK